MPKTAWQQQPTMLTTTATAVVAKMLSELYIAFGCTPVRPLQEVEKKSYIFVGSGEDKLHFCKKQAEKTVFLQEAERTNYIFVANRQKKKIFLQEAEKKKLYFCRKYRKKAHTFVEEEKLYFEGRRQEKNYITEQVPTKCT